MLKRRGKAILSEVQEEWAARRVSFWLRMQVASESVRRQWQQLIRTTHWLHLCNLVKDDDGEDEDGEDGWLQGRGEILFFSFDLINRAIYYSHTGSAQSRLGSARPVCLLRRRRSRRNWNRKIICFTFIRKREKNETFFFMCVRARACVCVWTPLLNLSHAISVISTLSHHGSIIFK